MKKQYERARKRLMRQQPAPDPRQERRRQLQREVNGERKIQ